MQNSQSFQSITVSTIVVASPAVVWDCWTNPKHITGWAFASDDWEAPFAENDLRVGGGFTTRMPAKDKSAAFDFGGTYTLVEPMKAIAYVMDDGRKVKVDFSETADGVVINETFDAETENSIELQRAGWQEILENFKKYTEKIA